jgi:hypothetical protein
MKGRKVSEQIDITIENSLGLLETLGEEPDFYETECRLILQDRDYLEEHRAEISEVQKARLIELDDQLQAKYLVLQEGICIFRYYRHKEDSGWWWFLDEGPQVREEMEGKNL